MPKMWLKFRAEPNGHTPLPKCPGIKGIHKFMPSSVASIFHSQKKSSSKDSPIPFHVKDKVPKTLHEPYVCLRQRRGCNSEAEVA